jgi:hypothetical protein
MASASTWFSFIGESARKRHVCATRAIVLAGPARIRADRRCRGDLAALGGAAAAWPLVARAQQPAQMRRRAVAQDIPELATRKVYRERSQCDKCEMLHTRLSPQLLW